MQLTNKREGINYVSAQLDDTSCYLLNGGHRTDGNISCFADVQVVSAVHHFDAERGTS